MHTIRNMGLVFVLLLPISPCLAVDDEVSKNDSLYERANDWLNLDSSEISHTKSNRKKKIVAEKEFSFAPSQDSKMEKLIKGAKQIFSSDPLSISRKSVDEQGRVSMFRPIRLGFVNFYDFKLRLTNTISYARDLGDERSVSLGLNYSPLVLKNPYGNMKMRSWDLNLGFRKYFNKKYFFQSNIGLRKYHPNHVYRSYYSSRGHRFENEKLPYMSVGIGRKIWDEVPIIKRPLVLIANYTFSKDLEFPAADPFGRNEIDLHGLDITVSVSFKI